MLKIEHLTKKYGSVKAVDDLSLHIRQGEIFGFIGHNGAGAHQGAGMYSLYCLLCFFGSVRHDPRPAHAAAQPDQ